MPFYIPSPFHQKQLRFDLERKLILCSLLILMLVSLLLPLHVPNQAVGGSVSSVPEPEMALLLALGVLMLAWMFFYKNWKIRRLMPGSR